MDARSAMRPCYILPMFFFHIFFMTALVGQTAEWIFTKLIFLALLKLHGGPKDVEILHIFDPTRTFSALTPERGKISQF